MQIVMHQKPCFSLNMSIFLHWGGFPPLLTEAPKGRGTVTGGVIAKHQPYNWAMLEHGAQTTYSQVFAGLLQAKLHFHNHC